jgi:hypothetical protein
MKYIIGLLAMFVTLAARGEMVKAQQPQKIYKIGRLSAGSPSDPLSKVTYDAFREGLRELGWIESSNIILESRWAGEPTASAFDLAAELVGAQG